jgi:multisubunit Na+/H+ antiporter MnhB subunit
MSHFGLMVVYALLVSVFFALLWRHERRQRIRMFAQVFLSLVGGGLVVAWILYFIPTGPPVPF